MAACSPSEPAGSRSISIRGTHLAIALALTQALSVLALPSSPLPILPHAKVTNRERYTLAFAAGSKLSSHFLREGGRLSRCVRPSVQGITALRGGAPRLPRLPCFREKSQITVAKNPTAMSSAAGGSMENKKHGGGIFGRAELLLVALLYGSLTVAFRFLYNLNGPPTAAALSFARGALAAACFIPSVMSMGSKSSGADASKRSTFWIAAVELAAWNLGSQGLLNVGLQFTEASRGSFLTQLSVVLTPVVSMFAGEKVSLDVGIGCLMALAGVVMLSNSDSAVAAASGIAPGLFGINVGDFFCVLGALCWSLYIFRLSCYMRKGVESTPLQAWKTIILAAMYGVWMLIEVAKSGWAWGLLWPGILNPLGLLVLVYSAAGPGAFADVIQSQAQARVSASEANVILSSEPLWAVLFGILMLGEVLTVKGALGGVLIVGAALVASGVFSKK